MTSTLMSLNTRADTGYTLGPGDVVKLSVYNQPNLTTETQISNSGALLVPLLGSVKIAGLTTDKASTVIARQLENSRILHEAHVNLLITEYRSRSIAVLGQVNQAGKFYLQGPTTLPEALALAGGVNANGSERVVLLRHDANGRQQRYEYDLQQWLDSHASQRSAIPVQAGDVVYVPLMDRFYVRGQVQQPGTYPLDRSLNVMQALALSGGLTDRARKDDWRLYRRNSEGKVEQINAQADDAIANGDVLVVGESLF
ncbi:MAG: polysaccharide biosynthesis/export family protein [Pseudomonadota bacterium]|nr:polysaccharide biosynthesis/export family protein [Pseudomonadota bacterium]